MLWRFLMCAGFLFSAGCIPTKQIIPSSDGGSFVLAEDVVKLNDGAFGAVWLVGLAKGEYIAFGHDEEGVYYRGPHKCIILLNEEQAQRYFETGERPGAMDDPNKMNVLTGDEGGVFVPYDLDNEQPQYFHYADYRNATGDVNSKIPPRPVSSINAAVPESIPAGVIEPAYNVRVIDPTNPTAVLPSPEVAAGTSIGLAVARPLGLAGLRDAQGGIIEGAYIKNEKILGIIRAARAKNAIVGRVSMQE